MWCRTSSAEAPRCRSATAGCVPATSRRASGETQRRTPSIVPARQECSPAAGGRLWWVSADVRCSTERARSWSAFLDPLVRRRLAPGLRRVTQRCCLPCGGDGFELDRRGSQILDDPPRDDLGSGQIVGIFQRFVPKPGDVQVGRTCRRRGQSTGRPKALNDPNSTSAQSSADTGPRCGVGQGAAKAHLSNST
jgi:hypothetical protein